MNDERHHRIASNVITKAMEKLAAAGIDRSVLASAAVSAGIRIALDDSGMSPTQVGGWLEDIAGAIDNPDDMPPAARAN